MNEKLSSEITLKDKESLIKDIANHERMLKTCNCNSNEGLKLSPVNHKTTRVPTIFIDGSPYEIAEMVSAKFIH